MVDSAQASPRTAGGSSSDQGPSPRFARLWRQGKQPDLAEFLSRAGALSRKDVADILRTDQRERWRTGKRVPAEDYLVDRLGTAVDGETAVDLVYQEFLLREELGETPTADEYRQRFPQFADQLAQQIEFHQALGPPEAPDSSASPTAATTANAKPAAEGWPDIPGYAITAELGRGGMGVVYQARQWGLNRQVALKMIVDGAHASPQELVRLHGEAEAVAQLQHPHIVQIYDVGEHQGSTYLALEFVEGGSLAQKVGGTPLPAREAAEIMETVARAVQFAHQRRIVHRDLKPANILLTKDGVPKIADFGLAKRTECDARLTGSGGVLGTPSFMPPEQAAGKSGEIGPLVDVYSLGATLYFLLTGRPPFQAANATETLRQVIDQEPVAPRRLNAAADRDLETICLKCLEKTPGRRYPSATDLADDLRRYLDGRPIQARRASWGEHAWRWARRNPAWAATLAAAVGLLSAVAIGGTVLSFRLQLAVSDARAAKNEARLRQAEALVGEAHGTRYSRREGQRFVALAALKKAAAIGRELKQPSQWFDHLRNEAIAALALPDLHITRQLPGRPQGTAHWIVSGDFQVYATSDESGVSVRRMENDAEIAKLPGGPVPAHLFLSQDGSQLGQVFRDDDAAFFARLWHLGPGNAKELVQIEMVHWMTFMDRPEGRLAICMHGNGAISVYPASTGQRQAYFEAVELTAHCLIVPHPHEPLVAISSYDHRPVLIRNILTGAVVQRELPPWPSESPGIGSTCAWHPSGRYLCIAKSDGPIVRVYHFDPTTGSLAYWRTIPCWHGHTMLAFNARGDRFVASGWGQTLSTWDFWTGQMLFQPKSKVVDWRYPPTLKPDGTELALAAVPERPDHVGVWSVADARECRPIVPSAGSAVYYQAFDLHPGGRLAAQSFTDGVRLFDLTTGVELAHVSNRGTAAEGRADAVAFDAAGTMYTNGFLGFFRWPLRRDPENKAKWTLGPPSRLPFHPGDERPGVSRDGSVLAQSMFGAFGMAPYAGGWILHPNSPTPRWVDAGTSYAYASVSPDGQFVAFAVAAGDTGTARVFEAATGKLVWQSPKAAGWCRFSSDGRWLLTGNAPGLAYAVGTWEPGSELGPGQLCDCIALDDTALDDTLLDDALGNSLAVLNLDNGVYRLVEMASGRELARLEDPDQHAGLARFTPDGTKLVAQARNGLRVWDLRRIRQELADIGLDWDAPPYPAEEPDASPATPLQVEVVGADFVTDPKKLAQLEVDVLTKLLQENPRDAHAQVRLADNLVRLDKHEAAYDAYSEALKWGGDSQEVLHQRALAAYRLNRWQAVIDDATRCLEKDPANGELLYRRGRSLRRLKRYEEALADFGAVITLFPNDAMNYIARAACYAALGQPDKAAADRERAIKLEPENPAVLNNLAWWLLTGPQDRRDTARALQAAGKAVEKEPGSALYQNTLGVAQYRSRHYQQAVATLEKSLALGKGEYDAFDLFFLAMCHAKLGDAARAKDCFDRAVKWIDQKQGLSAEHAKELKQFRLEAEAGLKN